MSLTDLFFSPRQTNEDLKGLQQATRLVARQVSAVNRKRKKEAEGMTAMIARLMLIVETQHRMLLKKGVCTAAEFEALLNEVDLEDGVADGRRTPR